MIRWAAFSCVLVPVVLVGYGTSLAGTAGTALGLAAVTGACRVLLRRSERGVARLHRSERGVARLHRSERSAARLRTEEPVPHHVRHGRVGTQTHRGGRHAGGNTPVD
ncbi:hypothetical protein [Streptomyces sp. NBC_00878]|uniref:hypothetical protein n=1 Tax=Streptomyces sp. NBC_00878 TaxID=2975854 RepID=UPI00224F0D0C|nr:hypothetical protein [Streptomyces sp. NBC_00878]MCX4908483.1 hypothetical protein [Streptomyces sp. NBC_00878]